jgi:hypothetical protein
MTKRIIAMFALVGALAFGVAACGDDESTSESSSSSTSEQKPVAEIANLTPASWRRLAR